MTLATWLIFLTGAGAAAFAAKQLKQSRELKRIENLHDLIKWFDGDMYLSTRQHLARKRLDQIANNDPLTDDNAPASAYRLLDFFEHIAWLKEKGYVSVDAIWNAFYDPCIHLYSDLLPLIEPERRAQDDNTIYTGVGTLVKALHEQQRREGGESLSPDNETVKRFYECEADLTFSQDA